MTEAEWLTSINVEKMLNHLQGLGGRRRTRQIAAYSKRKYRLLGCACCCRMADATVPAVRDLLAKAEQYSDRLIRKSELPAMINYREASLTERTVFSFAGRNGGNHSVRLEPISQPVLTEIRYILHN